MDIPRQYRKVQFVREAVTVRLAQRSDPPWGVTAADDLERYYMVLDEAVAQVALSYGEAMLIADALNGTVIDNTLIRFLWAEIEDSLEDGLAEKWGIDGPALVAKIRKMSTIQVLATVEAIERAWYTFDEENSLDDRLRQFGLIRD